MGLSRSGSSALPQAFWRKDRTEGGAARRSHYGLLRGTSHQDSVTAAPATGGAAVCAQMPAAEIYKDSHFGSSAAVTLAPARHQQTEQQDRANKQQEAACLPVPAGGCCFCWSPPGGSSRRGPPQWHGCSLGWSSCWGPLSLQPGAVECGLGTALAAPALCWSFLREAGDTGTAPAVGRLCAAGPRHGAASRDLGGLGHAPGGADGSGHGHASTMPLPCSWWSHSCWQSCAPRT